MLRQEGFLSGVRVSEQASLPVPTGEDHPLAGAAAFLFEVGHLKEASPRRAGCCWA